MKDKRKRQKTNLLLKSENNKKMENNIEEKTLELALKNSDSAEVIFVRGALIPAFNASS